MYSVPRYMYQGWESIPCISSFSVSDRGALATAPLTTIKARTYPAHGSVSFFCTTQACQADWKKLRRLEARGQQGDHLPWEERVTHEHRCVDKVSDVWKGTRQVRIGILAVCPRYAQVCPGVRAKMKRRTRGFGSEPDCIISWRPRQDAIARAVCTVD